MLSVSERCDMSCEILRATKDGNDLSPKDLWIIQESVNGNLNDKGWEYFADLHKRVTSGHYDKLKEYLFGVEHITKDHEGYVYFKGKHVEHYSFHGDWEGEKKAAQELQKRCLLLEKKGVEINTITAIWSIEKYLTNEELLTCQQ